MVRPCAPATGEIWNDISSAAPSVCPNSSAPTPRWADGIVEPVWPAPPGEFAAERLTHLVCNATMIRAAPALATRQW